MSYEIPLEELSKSIKEGNCVAFIGAGASAEYYSKDRTRFKGIPLANGLLKLLQSDKNYLSDCYSLGEAAFLLKNRSSRAYLEKFLENEINLITDPLPCHKLLAQLDFSAYVSMNFDELLEKELEKFGKNICRIINDKDISKIEPKSIPFLKPHGTISYPESIKISPDETLNFSTLFNLCLNFMLSNKTILFIGFSFSDLDFNNLIIKLNKELGEYFPKSYSVVLNASDYHIEYWKNFKIEIIQEDATLFLNNLHNEVRKSFKVIDRAREPWITSPFFQGFLNASFVPTETQIIDELLNSVNNAISNKMNFNRISNSVRSAIDDVLHYKPNFIALKNLQLDFESLFIRAQKGEITLKAALEKLVVDQKKIKNKIEDKRQIIDGYKNILLYSQSQRVADLLTSYTNEEQSTKNLFILECREKSTDEYNEGQAIINLFRETKFNLSICSDLTGLKMIKQNKIDLIIFGAHSVHLDKDDNSYIGFTNTCGTGIFVELAELFKVKVAIVFELDKGETDEDFEKKHTISEIDLGNVLYDGLDEYLKENGNLIFESSNYDYISWRNDFLPITDE